MKILLDVGAHTGQTARAAIHQRYRFDRIYCFEPAPECWPEIESIPDERIELCRYGLWNETTRRRLYGPGRVGASLFPDARSIEGCEECIEIDVVRTSDWVAEHTRPGDVIFMKLNCEGSECDILEDLVDSGRIADIYNVMVDFDVRKIPSMRHRQFRTRRLLRQRGIDNVCYQEDVMIGPNHTARLEYWLCMVGGHEDLELSRLRAKYGVQLHRLSRQPTGLGRIEMALANSRLWTGLPPRLRQRIRPAWKLLRGH